MNTTTRKFPRTLREAFPGDYRESAQGIAGPVVVPTRTWRGSIDEQMRKAREFVQVYRLYRNHGFSVVQSIKHAYRQVRGY